MKIPERLLAFNGSNRRCLSRIAHSDRRTGMSAIGLFSAMPSVRPCIHYRILAAAQALLSPRTFITRSGRRVACPESPWTLTTIRYLVITSTIFLSDGLTITILFCTMVKS